MLLTACLKELCPEVRSFRNLEEAMSYFEDGGKAGLIVTDYSFPNGTGFQFIANLNALNFFNASFICVSGTERPKNAISPPFSKETWLMKPFNPEKLIELATKLWK